MKKYLFLLLFFVPQYSFAALPAIGDLPQTAGIESRWYLNEASGVREDFVGTNDLTDNNTVGSMAGQFSELQADFERSNSEYLSRADNASLSPVGAFSVSFWAQKESDNSSQIFVSKLGSGGSSQEAFSFYVDSANKLSMYIKSASGNDDWNSSVNFLVSEGAVFLTFVYQPSTRLTIYKDGVEVAEFTTSVEASIQDVSVDWQIGRNGYGNYFDGGLQDFVYWDSTALTDLEVSDLYDAYFPPPPSSSSSSSSSVPSCSGTGCLSTATGALLIGNSSCTSFSSSGSGGTVCVEWQHLVEIPAVRFMVRSGQFSEFHTLALFGLFLLIVYFVGKILGWIWRVLTSPLR